MAIVTTADDTVNQNDGVQSLREALAQAGESYPSRPRNS